jgi:hypothetical protein
MDNHVFIDKGCDGGLSDMIGEFKQRSIGRGLAQFDETSKYHTLVIGPSR